MNFIPAATLTDAEAAVVDALMPGNQVKQVGSRLQALEQRAPFIQKVVIDADYHTVAKSFLVEANGEIVDVWAVGTASSGSGTATLRRSTTAISSAIVCAAADVLSRTTTIVQAQNPAVQGEALNVITNGANDRGVLYIAIRRS